MKLLGFLLPFSYKKWVMAHLPLHLAEPSEAAIKWNNNYFKALDVSQCLLTGLDGAASILRNAFCSKRF
jgi:hypothetical protein